jgi:hypothetical protein
MAKFHFLVGANSYKRCDVLTYGIKIYDLITEWIYCGCESVFLITLWIKSFKETKEMIFMYPYVLVLQKPNELSI